MSKETGNPKTHGDYAVAIICTMSFEMSSVRYMLEREHPRLPNRDGDANVYILGEVEGHNIVLTCLPRQKGKGAAAIVATNLAGTFTSIEWHFFVGIGGGVPSAEHDIRLGDVVVSMPEGTYGGVAQYDLGKETDDGYVLKGFLSAPPDHLRSAVEIMESDHLLSGNKIEEFISKMLARGPGLSVYRHPNDAEDVLFHHDSLHIPNEGTCGKCDRTNTIQRYQRQPSGPIIHYGLIASGDSVIKSASKRAEIVKRLGDVLCIDMEAAGPMSKFPCMVIRGISNYCDSHKNDKWQFYAAAAAAAACTKELLSYVTSKKPSSAPTPLSNTVVPENRRWQGPTNTLSAAVFSTQGTGMFLSVGNMNFN